MKKMRVSTLLILLSTVFAVLAAATVEAELRQQINDIKAREKSISVVVAKSNIPAHTVIGPSMVQVQNIPAGGISPGAYQNQGLVLGKVTTQTIYSGEQILPGLLTDKTTSSDFADRIPPGYVAISVLFNPVLDGDGKISAGDHVAIISVLNKGYNSTQKDSAQIIAKNVLVLSVPSAAPAANMGGQTAQKAINLAVTPQEANMIAFTSVYGQIYVVLQSNGGGLDGTPLAVTDSTIE